MRKGRFAGLNIAAPEPEAGGRVQPAIAAMLAITAPTLVALVALLTRHPAWTVATMAGAVLLAWAALRRLLEQPAEPLAGAAAEAARAAHLISDFEESGSGWFWETNADGRLAYLSQPLATELGREVRHLLGRPFTELLLVEEGVGSDLQRPTLGFHLSSRFPFANVVVTPNGRHDLGWSISGRPRFDEVGRFLGFHGIGLNLSEGQRAEMKSSALAACDSLTGLPNRARMRAMLDEALGNSASRREGCALLMIDLDRFKQVNDTLGHPVGDLLLKEVAQRLSSALGGEGQVGRLGGDEFEAVLPGIDEEGHLAALAERVIARVSAPYLIREHNVAIGASVGIAISRPGKTLADALVKEADLALYAAKKAGRGTYRFFEREMHAQETGRLILESDLKAAVAKRQLRLVFQPVVKADSEDLVGFEALVRWLHPVRGPLAPADFLPLAETCGMIIPIGEWVLRAACAAAAAWPAHVRVAINLSRTEIEAPQLVATVANALAESGLDPNRVELDLTEPTLLADNVETRSVLAGLKALGVRLALDDFGAGAASVASLNRAELDRVKIHPRLLRAAMQEGSRAQTVLAAVIALADRLGIDVTAEGIESAEELALVRRLGCSDIQGFLFGRPMAIDQAIARAADSKPMSAGDGFRARPPRHSLIRRGTLRWKGETLPVRLRNISAEGAMIEGDQEPENGTPVEIDLSDGIRLRAEVRWSHDGRIGVRFANAFDLQRLGKARRTAVKPLVKPEYLESELAPDSPWAARRERFSVKNAKRK